MSAIPNRTSTITNACGLVPHCVRLLHRMFSLPTVLNMYFSTAHRYLTLFAGIAPVPLAMQVWDLFMFEGGFVITKVTLALLTLSERDIVAAEDPQTLNRALANCPQCLHSATEVIKLR